MKHLEVISHGPGGATRPTPLLFVHGAYAGAWVWEPFFLPFFASHGYDAHALSLRGHGMSGGREELSSARLRHYVADVEAIMAELPRPPVLIGHSMGGVIVQHLMHRHKNSLPAAVLLASGPPHGMVPSLWSMAIRRPGLLWQIMLVQTLGPLVADMSWIRAALFSEHAPEDIVRHSIPRLGPESVMVTWDLLGLDLPPSRPALDLPVLVLGADQDAFIAPGAVDETARTYRTTADMFPSMAHAMMIDYHWHRVATRVLEWLDTTLPVVQRAA